MFSHIKRMQTYRQSLPITPYNYKFNLHKGIHGGSFNTVSDSNLWINPIPAQLQGVPIYLLQHPNKYGGSKAQIMLYNSYEDFVNTAFYKQYESQIKSIPIPPKFAMQSTNNGWLDHISYAYGQKLRMIFVQGDTKGQGVVGISKNFYSYYLDFININDYITALGVIYKDRDDIQPVEAAAILRIKHNDDVANANLNTANANYNRGGTDMHNQDEAEEQAEQEQAQEQADAEKSDDSSSIWGDISTGLEVVAAFL